MRVRCYTCGKIASTRHPCRSCGSKSPIWHCHNRAHMRHTIRGEAFGYQRESLGPCLDGHVHPYEDYGHLNEPEHRSSTSS